MVIKMILTLASLAPMSCVTAGSANVKEEKTQNSKYSSSQFLKNYALSSCMAYAFDDQVLVSEAAAASRGYLELGDHPIEAYNEAALLAKEYLNKTYNSKHGQKLQIMKCIDLFHSDELEKIAKKHQP